MDEIKTWLKYNVDLKRTFEGIQIFTSSLQIASRLQSEVLDINFICSNET